MLWQRPVDLADSVTSYGRGRRRYRGIVRVHGRRVGASGCRGGCRHSRPAVRPRWCFVRHGWAQEGS
jgi:hypothetical protein